MAVKKTAAAKPAAPKKTVTKTAAKPQTKKAPAKKEADDDRDLAIEVSLQYQGRDIDLAEVIDRVLDAAEDKDPDNKAKKVGVFIQPENGVAYYTIDDNGSDDYKVEI